MSSTTLQRHWLLLSRVPRAPRKIDAATLERILRDEGYPIHRRTIQRDLQALSCVFPIVHDEETRPYGWSWSRDAEGLKVSSMAPHTALLFQLAADVLEPVLPEETFRFVKAHLATASAVLKGSDPRLAAWARGLRAELGRAAVTIAMRSGTGGGAGAGSASSARRGLSRPRGK